MKNLKVEIENGVYSVVNIGVRLDAKERFQTLSVLRMQATFRTEHMRYSDHTWKRFL